MTKIFCKSMTKGTYTCDFDDSTTIADLKAQLSSLISGYPNPESITLIYGGNVLSDDLVVSKSKEIAQATILHVIIKQ